MNSKLYTAINKILWEEWDPIGVNDYGGPDDEYHSYVPHLYKLLTQGADTHKITKHLHQLANVSMGLSSSLDDHLLIAEKLVSLVKNI